MDSCDLLTKTQKRLKRRNAWTKHTFYIREQKVGLFHKKYPACLIGAVRDEIDGKPFGIHDQYPEYREAVQRLHKALPLSHQSSSSEVYAQEAAVIGFNDAPTTTHKDVQHLLKTVTEDCK